MVLAEPASPTSGRHSLTPGAGAWQSEKGKELLVIRTSSMEADAPLTRTAGTPSMTRLQTGTTSAMLGSGQAGLVTVQVSHASPR